MTYPLAKALNWLIVLQLFELAKISFIGSRSCAFQCAIDEARTLPQSTPKWRRKNAISLFLLINLTLCSVMLQNLAALL